MKNILLFTTLIMFFASWSVAESPIGKWKTIDDQTGEAKSIIDIREENGEIFGTIEVLFRKPEQNPNPLCTRCKGSLRNQPVIGLTILKNLRQNGSEWNGGTVLDPENGNTYRCKLEVVDNGTRLKVRGFIGVSMLGRTQYWLRAE